MSFLRPEFLNYVKNRRAPVPNTTKERKLFRRWILKWLGIEERMAVVERSNMKLHEDCLILAQNVASLSRCVSRVQDHVIKDLQNKIDDHKYQLGEA